MTKNKSSQLTKALLLKVAASKGITHVGGIPVSKVKRDDLYDAITARIYEEEEAKRPVKESMSLGDMTLIRSACNKGYDIPEDELSRTPTILVEIMESKKSKRREKVAAAKTLLAIRKHTLNQAALAWSLISDGAGGDGTLPKRIISPFPIPDLE